VLEGHNRHHQLATAYCSHLKARNQLIGKSLQEFATAIKQSLSGSRSTLSTESQLRYLLME
jgi:hypothetical protein